VILTVLAVLVSSSGTVRPEPPELSGRGRASRFIEPVLEPSAVAVGPDGSIYVSEALGNRVSVFDRTGAPLRRWGSLGKGEREFDGPRGISVSEDGRVYVADTGNDRIQVFTADGRFERQWGRHGAGAGEFDEPLGLVAAGDRVFVADSRNNRIQVFGRDGTFLFFVWSYGYHDGAFDRPVDVAVDRDGNFYVSDQGNSRIQKFSPEGRFVVAWGGKGRLGGLLDEPGGLDERDGRLIVADPYSHRLVTFDRSGTLLGEWSASGGYGSQGLDAPSDVASFASGDELVVCSAVEDRCQVVVPGEDPAPATEDGSRPIARDGYAVGGAGDALVVASRETGVPFIIDLSRKAPGLILKLGGSGREPGEFMRPSGFDLDRSGGTILVSDSGNARLQRLELGPNATTSFVRGIVLGDQEKLDVEPGGWGLDPATVEPGAIARDSRGRLFLADTVGRRIVVLDRDFHLVGSWGGFGDEDGRFRNPVGLAIAPAGSTVYVLDAGQRRVQAFGIDGRFRFAWGGTGEAPGEFLAPSGISIGKDGSVYVVDRGANRVQRFDRRGARISAWGSEGSGPGQFRKPEAVHVDGRGRVIVIDSGNRRAQLFTAAGRFVSEFSLDPTKMTAAPVRRSRPVRKAARHAGSPEVCRASIASNGGRYTVCATTLPDPVPQNAPFAVSVSVYENSPGGALAHNVILDVDATMPEHHHGMTVTPQVRAIGGPAVQELLTGHGAMGNGRFEVRGMLFHMPGRWEIHFDITHGAITERAQFEIELD
jgi:tripartite motif-containing protein 71